MPETKFEDFDKVIGKEEQPQAQESQFEDFEAYEQAAEEAKTQEIARDVAVESISAVIPGATPGLIDKASRIASGTLGFIKSAAVDAPKALSYWVASKFFDDEELDSKEERKALMYAVNNVYNTVNPASPVIEKLANDATEALELGIDQHGGKDFVDLAEEGEIVEAADAFLGDVASALPSVGAAFLGPGGLALIGGSAFGGKFTEQLESDTEASSDRILLNAASSAGGEILSEAFTAGLGGGLTKLATKLGPKAAKAILRNTGSKLAFGFTGEGLSEVAAEAWDKAGDYAILGEEKAFDGAMRDFGKTFLLGGAIGGGITISQLSNSARPGAVDAVKSASTPPIIRESQKKSAGRLNALQIDLQDAQQNGDEFLIEEIQEEIKSERARLKRSQDNVDKQLLQHDGEQVKQLVEEGNKIDEYNRRLEEGDINAATEALLRKHKDEAIERQEKIFENPNGLDIAKAKPINPKSIELSNAAQKAWVDGRHHDVVKHLDGAIRQKVFNYWNSQDPLVKEKVSFEEALSNALHGKRGAFESSKQFNPERSASVAKHVLGRVQTRVEEFIHGQQERFKKGKIVNDPTATIDRQSAGEVASNLTIAPEVLNDAVKDVEHFDLQLKDLKTPKDYIAKQKKFFEGRLAPKIKNIIRKEGKKSYNQFVRKNVANLKDLALRRPAAKTGITKEWGTRTPSDREFAEFFMGTDLTGPNTAANSKTLTKRKERLENLIGDALGQKAWGEYLDANKTARDRVAELNDIKARKISENIKPGSTTDYAFQEDSQPAEDDFAGQSRATNKVLEENGQGKTLDSKDPQQYEKMRNWVGDTMSSYFPRSFFNSGGFWNAGKSAAKRGFFFETEADFNDTTDGSKFKDGYDYSKAQRYHYKDKSIDKLIADKSILDGRNKANQDAFNEMWRTFDQMIKDDPGNAPYIAAFLKGAQNSQNHFSRTGAPIVAYSKTGPYVEEHAMPQSAVSRYLLNTVLSGGDINSALKNTNRNFVQVALNKIDDGSLKKNKIGPNGANLNSNMPAGWKPSDNWLARYFNDSSEIDPSSIVFLDSGKSVLDTYIPRISESINTHGIGGRVRRQQQPKPPKSDFTREEIKKIRYGDFSGTRAGAEFRINESINQVIADKVRDQTRRKVDQALAERYDIKSLESDYDGPRNVEAIVDILNANWEGRGVEVTTDPVYAKDYVVNKQQISPRYADKVLARSNGFAVGDLVYVSKDASREVPMHEYGHIWNHMMQDRNPKTFDAIFEKIQTEAPEIFQQQLDRIGSRAYDLKEGTPEWKDEVMAGIIGYHGIGKIDTKKSGGTMKEILKEYWDAIKKMIGFDFAGKDLADVRVDQVLDLILDEVVYAKPGENVLQLLIPKPDPTVQGLENFNGEYAKTGNVIESLQKSIPEGYDLNSWADFINNNIKENRTKQNSENQLEYFGPRVQPDPKSIPLRENRIEPTNPEQLSKLTDFVVKRKKLGAVTNTLNKIIVPPAAEDFKGLLYRLAGSSQDLNFLKDNLLDTYTAGVEAFKANRLATTKQLNVALKGLGYGWRTGAKKKMADDVEARQAIFEGKEGSQRVSDYVRDIGKVDNGKFLEYLQEQQSGDPIPAQFLKYQNKTTRKQYLGDFKTNADAMLRGPDGKIKEEITNKLGKDYASSLDNILNRMERGTNRKQGENDQEADTVLNFINQSNAVIMFLNSRSAALQMLSTLNYVRPAFAKNPVKAIKNYGKAIKYLAKSDYIKDRFSGAQFDVSADDLVNQSATSWMGRAVNKSAEFGFLPTKVFDAAAIISGGALYLASITEDGDFDSSMKEFTKFTEENQQSADPSRISKTQASSMGRVLFAFLNTPFQYTRLTKRAVQDIANKRGNVGDNVSKIAYYGAVQTAMFTMAQQALSFADIGEWFDDEEDENTGSKIEFAIDGTITGWMKTYGGLPGAGASALYGIGREYQNQADGGRVNPYKLAAKALDVSPPISRKIRSIKEVGTSLYKQNRKDIMQKGLKSPKLWQVVGDAGDVFNLPSSRIYDKYMNLADAVDHPSLSQWQRFLKGIGYTDYSLGIQKSKKKKDIFADHDFNKEVEFTDFKDLNKDSPFDRDEAGQVFADGSIEIDPNLSPLEREKTIKHEMQHVKDMKENGLDYDEQFVYFKGEKFARSNGQIEYNGKMYKEGAKELPWEGRAYNAE